MYICQWQSGKTALMYATEFTRTDSVNVARVLLEHGAKMEAKDHVREFAFCYECRWFYTVFPYEVLGVHSRPICVFAVCTPDHDLVTFQSAFIQFEFLYLCV